MCANGALRPLRRTPLIIREEAAPPLKSYQPKQINAGEKKALNKIDNELDELSQTTINRPIDLTNFPIPSKIKNGS